MLSLPSADGYDPTPDTAYDFFRIDLKVWAVDTQPITVIYTICKISVSHKDHAQKTGPSATAHCKGFLRTAQGMNKTDLCISCGYVRENGKPAFTDFYTAILDAQGIINAIEPEEIKAEDSDYQEQINELLEDYPADAIYGAFIELLWRGRFDPAH